MDVIEDVIENGAPAGGPSRRVIIWLTVGAIVVAAGIYAGNRLIGVPDTAAAAPPTLSQTPAPTARKSTERAATPATSTAVVPQDLINRAMAAINAGGSISGGGLAVVGSDFRNGTDTLGLEEGSIGGPGRIELLMLCLGQGAIQAHAADGSGPDWDPAVGTQVQLSCAAEPGPPTSAEVSVNTGFLRLYMRPRADTVAAFAFRIRRL